MRNWLYSMPIPQTKIALGIVMSLIVSGAYAYCLIRAIEVDEGGLAVMCAFIAGVFGIGAKEYQIKRTTDLDYIKEVGNANAGIEK